MKNKHQLKHTAACAAAMLAAFAFNTAALAQVTVSEMADTSPRTLLLLSDEDVEAKIYTPQYSDGSLSEVGVYSASLTANEAKSLEIGDVSDGAEVLVWDSSLQPLCAPYVVGSNITAPEPEGDGIIHLCDTYIDAAGVDNVTVDGTILTITAAGDYIIEGTLSDGQIVVSDKIGKKEAVGIELRGVSVTCKNSAPFNGGGGKITITLAEGTTNTFSDNKKYTAYTTEKDPKGCFYSRRDLDISGEGLLVVNGNYKNGLVCGADLKIKKKASIEVTAVNNAVKGDNGVTFTDKTGTVKITAEEGDAIKSDAIIETDDGTLIIEEGNGYVTIEGGSFELSAPYGDGIQVDSSCTISGGNVNITAGAEGIKANEVMLLLADEDGEAPYVDGETGEYVYVNGTAEISGGTVNIISGEDGIKICELLEISGGTVTITAGGEEADAIQVGESEKTTSTSGGSTTTTENVIVAGNFILSGGEVVINEATDDAVVCRGSFIMTGGSLSGKSDCDFIKAYDKVDISAGSLNIESGNDGIQSGKALVETETGSTVTESNITAGELSISGGEITIKTNGGHSTAMSDSDPSAKGIKANGNLCISGGSINVDSSDDAIHSNSNVTVTGGNMLIATGDDGIHADKILTLGTEGGADDDFVIEVTASYEGVEGSVINFYSGTVYVYSTDDGINAAGDYSEAELMDVELAAWGGWGSNWGGGPDHGGDDSASYGKIYIKGGKVYVEAYGDGLDSNGSIEMSGGTVIINGPTNSGNGVFDIGDTNGSTFNVTGGTLIGAGTSGMAVTPKATNGYYLSSSSSGGNRPGGSSTSFNAGTPVKITTSDGYIIFIPKVQTQWLYVTTPDMKSGSSFSASSMTSYSGGTQILGKTVGTTFYGLVSVEE